MKMIKGMMIIFQSFESIPVKDIDFSIAEKGYELTNIALSIAAEA